MLWVETLTEAYFLHKTLFRSAEPDSAEDDAYMASLLDKVTVQVDSVTQSLKSFGELEGAIDQFCETAEVTKVRVQN